MNPTRVHRAALHAQRECPHPSDRQPVEDASRGHILLRRHRSAHNVLPAVMFPRRKRQVARLVPRACIPALLAPRVAQSVHLDTTRRHRAPRVAFPARRAHTRQLKLRRAQTAAPAVFRLFREAGSVRVARRRCTRRPPRQVARTVAQGPTPPLRVQRLALHASPVDFKC